MVYHVLSSFLIDCRLDFLNNSFLAPTILNDWARKSHLKSGLVLITNPYTLIHIPWAQLFNILTFYVYCKFYMHVWSQMQTHTPTQITADAGVYLHFHCLFHRHWGWWFEVLLGPVILANILHINVISLFSND